MKKGPMLSCEDATRLVVMKETVKLGLYDRMRLKMHLSMCKYCSLFEKQNEIIDEHIKEVETVVVKEMPEDARLRIKNEIIHPE